jgi:hypothetical protein
MLTQGATDVPDVDSSWMLFPHDAEGRPSVATPVFATESARQEHLVAALISLAARYEHIYRETDERCEHVYSFLVGSQGFKKLEQAEADWTS